MNPTSFLFGAMLFAFLFYITTRGDLAKWLGLLGLSSSPSSGAGNYGGFSPATIGTLGPLPNELELSH